MIGIGSSQPTNEPRLPPRTTIPSDDNEMDVFHLEMRARVRDAIISNDVGLVYFFFECTDAGVAHDKEEAGTELDYTFEKDNGRGLLHFATTVPMIQTLVRFGVPSVRDNYGRHPLWYHAQAGRCDLARALFSSFKKYPFMFYDWTLHDKEGVTPLVAAIRAGGGTLEMIRILVDLFTSNVYAVAREGGNDLEIIEAAMDVGNEAVLQYLSESHPFFAEVPALVGPSRCILRAIREEKRSFLFAMHEQLLSRPPLREQLPAILKSVANQLVRASEGGYLEALWKVFPEALPSYHALRDCAARGSYALNRQVFGYLRSSQPYDRFAEIYVDIAIAQGNSQGLLGILEVLCAGENIWSMGTPAHAWLCVRTLSMCSSRNQEEMFMTIVSFFKRASVVPDGEITHGVFDCAMLESRFRMARVALRWDRESCLRSIVEMQASGANATINTATHRLLLEYIAAAGEEFGGGGGGAGEHVVRCVWRVLNKDYGGNISEVIVRKFARLMRHLSADVFLQHLDAMLDFRNASHRRFLDVLLACSPMVKYWPNACRYLVSVADAVTCVTPFAAMLARWRSRGEIDDAECEALFRVAMEFSSFEVASALCSRRTTPDHEAELEDAITAALGALRAKGREASTEAEAAEAHNELRLARAMLVGDTVAAVRLGDECGARSVVALCDIWTWPTLNAILKMKDVVLREILRDEKNLQLISKHIFDEDRFLNCCSVVQAELQLDKHKEKKQESSIHRPMRPVGTPTEMLSAIRRVCNLMDAEEQRDDARVGVLSSNMLLFIFDVERMVAERGVTYADAVCDIVKFGCCAFNKHIFDAVHAYLCISRAAAFLDDNIKRGVASACSIIIPPWWFENPSHALKL